MPSFMVWPCHGLAVPWFGSAMAWALTLLRPIVDRHDAHHAGAVIPVMISAERSGHTKEDSEFTESLMGNAQ